MQLTIAQIAAFSQALTIVPARDAQRVVQRVVWDTRALQPGTLFVALPGERADGNDFIREAFEKGAAAVVASRQVVEAERFAAERHKAALLYAPDGLLALQRLASAWRGQLDAQVVGITGSSGKTSTKALVSAVLERAFLTVSSLGNRNNEVGLPATVLSASLATEALVVEMAMRGRGQIADLCAIARPQTGIVTNVGPVHLELLGTKDNVARAKAELVEALPDGRGVAVLGGDDPYTPLIREVARTAERDLRVLLFGLGAHNDIRATAIEYDEAARPSFDLWLPDGDPRRVRLRLQGRHSVVNALAAAAAGTSLGVPASQLVSALEQVQPVPMRQVEHGLDDGTLLIDDTYNANPDSMRAALELLGRFPAGRLRVAVLGDMGELGEGEAALHEGVGAAVRQNGIDVLVCVGARARSYAQGARAAGMDGASVVVCDDIEGAAATLAPLRDEAPVILVKASRFMRLERLVTLLIEGRHDDGQPPEGRNDDGQDGQAPGGGGDAEAMWYAERDGQAPEGGQAIDDGQTPDDGQDEEEGAP
ncbi:MAG: UDP-N-acetylmuramoyl-tripeptide--D-alanyl-D-alanine ligase [Coriobacteriales bacterium]|jgi:UDP-N-acetylmuramoyl-tripeptide--D-alanyl-D-alanine ligase|nr:UDP-N-acetylmuramoyl-tripeptide--D-alanyl-D-alanine ligase [Coriobacteriales bacterium]